MIMKRTVFLFVLVITSLSCRQQEQKEFFIISAGTEKRLNGEVLLRNETKDWYDIQLTGDYVGVLNYESDTIFELYHLKNLNRIYADIEQYGNSLPRFIKKEAHDQTPTWSVLNNRNGMYKRYGLEDNTITEQISYLPGYDGLPVFSECTLVDKEVYGVPLEPKFLSTFYRFIPNEERIIGEPLIQDPTFKREPLAYLSHFAVNRGKKIVVTGLRFYNVLHYYTIAGDLLYTGMWGESLSVPVKNARNKNLDIENSLKHFTSLQATPTNVYSLYAGNSNRKEGASTLIVLDWKGIPQITYLLDRPVTAFSVGESKGIIIAISRADKGTEIISYKL